MSSASRKPSKPLRGQAAVSKVPIQATTGKTPSSKAPLSKASIKAPAYSDDNKSWLKQVSKKRDLFDEDEDEEDEDEEDDELDEIDDDDDGEEGEEEDDDEDDDNDDMGGEDADDGITGGDDDDDEDDEEDDGDDDDVDGDDGDELEFERKARQTVSRLAKQSAANEEELQKQLASEQIELPTADELDEEASRPPDVSHVRERVKMVAEVLSDFAVKRAPGRSRTEYMDVFSADLSVVYGYSSELIDLLLGLFSPAECLSFIEASETPRPVTVRTNTLRTRRRELAQALIARNVNLDPIAKWSKDGLQIYESAVPIGATPEYLAGHYMVQSASSFLPVLALSPQPGQRVLDMAASPGGKASHLAAMMANRGTLVANDASKERLRSLQANLQRLGVRNAIVMNADGRDYPKLMGGFDRVLLDAPCSGLGVISKDPSVKAEKRYSDVQRCQQLQRELLLAAIDATLANQPGNEESGFIVYSTCSISVEENEAVIDYVLKSRPVKVVDTGLPFGVEGLTRHRTKRFHSSLKLARRFYPHTHNMDGFFVCKLRKYANALTPETAAAVSTGASSSAAAADEEAGPSTSAVMSAGKQGAATGKGVKAGVKRKASAVDPSKAPGPAPKPGAERPGGGKHGDGEARKLKRLKAMQKLASRSAGKKAKRQKVL